MPNPHALKRGIDTVSLEFGLLETLNFVKTEIILSTDTVTRI